MNMSKNADKKTTTTCVSAAYLILNQDSPNTSHYDEETVYLMETLNLSYYNLLDMPMDLTRFENLLHLNVSYNELGGFDGDYILKSCPRLMRLNVSNNKISDIRYLYPLSHLQHLEDLDISNNPIYLNQNRIALLQHLLFLSSFVPHQQETISQNNRKREFFTKENSQSPSSSKYRFMLQTQSSARRLSLSPSQSSSPTTLHRNQSISKLRTSLSSLTNSERLSSTSPQKQLLQRKESGTEQKFATRDSKDSEFDIEDEEQYSNETKPVDEELSDSYIFRKIQKMRPAEATMVSSTCNMHPFWQSVKQLTHIKSTPQKTRSCPVPRDRNSPFPMLHVLNGLEVTVEEYLFAENEEVYDICAKSGTLNPQQKKSKDKDLENKIQNEDEGIDDGSTFSQPKSFRRKNEYEYSKTIPEESDLNVELLRQEFKRSRKVIDTILGVKRSNKIDFRPFKHQIQDLNKDEIELKLKRIELNDKLRYWNTILDDSFESKVGVASECTVENIRRRPSSASSAQYRQRQNRVFKSKIESTIEAHSSNLSKDAQRRLEEDQIVQLFLQRR